MSEDPIGLAGGINPYTFAGNDPINNYDPTGTACWRVTIWQTTTRVLPDGTISVTAKKLKEWTECDDDGGREYRDGIGIGGGGGSGPANDQSPEGDGTEANEEQSCALLGFATFVSAAGDAAFLYGARVVVVGVSRAAVGMSAALKAGTYGLSGLWGSAQGRAMATVISGRLAGRSAVARGSALSAAGAAGGTLASDGIQTSGMGLATGGLSWRDFVPIEGTRRAYRAWQACRAGS